ncbi:MAG: hypothetical protein CVU63_21560, partial [Deltaproteobacteria bacterium HGW-Deltaproteobacteria-20]
MGHTACYAFGKNLRPGKQQAMKRHATGLLLGLSAMVLSGCPIYPNEIECYDNFDCSSGTYCNEYNHCVEPPGTGGFGGSGGSAGSGGSSNSC